RGLNAHASPGDEERGDDDLRYDLGARAATPPDARKDGGRGEDGDHGECRLPPHTEQPRDRRGKAIAANTEGCAAQHHGGGGPAIAGRGNDSTEPEAHDDASETDDRRLGKGDIKTEDEGPIRESEHGHVGPEPGPEEFSRETSTLVFGDDVDAVLFNAE